RFDPLGRGQYPRFMLLERRRHEPLPIGDRLSALIIRRNEMEVRLRDLDVIAEHFVEADLERLESRSLPLVGLNSGYQILSAYTMITQRIELGVGAGRDRRLVAERNRRLGHDGRSNQLGEIGAVIPLPQSYAEPASGGHQVERRLRLRQSCQ